MNGRWTLVNDDDGDDHGRSYDDMERGYTLEHGIGLKDTYHHYHHRSISSASLTFLYI